MKALGDTRGTWRRARGISACSHVVSILLLVQTCLMGCQRIEYRAQLTIAPDGAAHRVAQYSPGHGGREVLESRYLLPSDGRWEIKQHKRAVQVGAALKDTTWDESIYRMERHYAFGESIPADYVRVSEYTSNTSSNEMRLRTDRFGLFTLFSYEETFQDSSKERALMVLEKYQQLQTALLILQLDVQLQGKVPKRRLRELILRHTSRARAEVAEIINRQDVRGAIDIEADETLEEEFGERLAKVGESQWLAEPLSRDLARQTEWSDPAIRVTIASALEKASKQVETLRAQAGNHLFEGMAEDFLGLHGIFADHYVMQIDVSMPGKLLDYNGHVEPEGTLRWNFEGGTFTWEPYRMQARSVVFSPARIVLVCSLCLLIASLWYRRRRTTFR